MIYRFDFESNVHRDKIIRKLTEKLGSKFKGCLTENTISVEGLTPTEQAEFDKLFEQPINFEAGLQAFENWSSLTLSQKDTILKNVLKYILLKEGCF
ncbi:hypothetical protein KKF61_09155 [Patescibacteria group bacterium]|nr:hypothetical protein [Patescibacteria group bacterium]